VPFGGVNQTAIIGDVEIQYRVNEDGTLNFRMFNRENDVNYIGQGIVYTQGLGLSYEIDFDNFNELVNKIFKKIKSENNPKRNTSERDSNELIDDSIKLPKPELPKPILNKEGVIPEED
jgi:hypothetical protein